MNFAFYLHDEKSQEEFEQKLLWFKSRYNLVGMQDIIDCVYKGKKLKNACHLTVDDGWLSTYEVIFPIMQKHNVPFTVFLSPHVLESGMNFWYYTYKFCNPEELTKAMIRRGHYSEEVMKFSPEMLLKQLPIDEIYDIINECMSMHPEISVPRGFMNTTEVKEMLRSGLVEVGAHTIIHPVLANESQERSEKEIKDSIVGLNNLLDINVRTMAYPNGIEGLDYGIREMDIAKNAGIRLAFSVDPGVINSSVNPLSVPRWGSYARLKFGRLGMYLPSRMNQANIRKEILKYKLR